MWDKATLQKIISEKMGDYSLIVASNRQPFRHIMRSGKIICEREPGGLVTALHPVMQAAHEALWVATGTSEYDRKSVDSRNKVMVPQENPSYTLKRVFLTKAEHDSYYYGYCNEGLWPLCHIAYTRPNFLISDWEAYEKVNRKFADSILEEIGDRKAFIWAQDFHLVLLAKYLKERGASNIITATFWHIPWPNAEVFRICPQKKEILEGLLAYDLIGFQVKYHADNFVACVERELESRIDREKNTVNYQNHETFLRSFPISIDFSSISKQAESQDGIDRVEKLRQDLELDGKKLLVGVDRIDYTKGIPERLRAIDRFLEKYPEYREKFVFFQLGQISRLHITRYKQLNDEINNLIEEINWTHEQGGWVPIVFRRTYMSYQDILALYRLADGCLVSSLHDGMNLVAKEFVSSRSDLDGVLILSRFTGSARELEDAILINPYDSDAFADAIYQAFQMPAEERSKRMQKMREQVEVQNIYRWAGKVLSQLLKFEFQEV